MKLDKDSPPGKPKVARESAKAILPVAIEVVEYLTADDRVESFDGADVHFRIR